MGIVLAVAYHLLSGLMQAWTSKQQPTLMMAFALVGFFLRLAVVAGILVALGLWSSLNFLAVCLAFIVVFTILNGILLYRLAVRRKSGASSRDTNGES